MRLSQYLKQNLGEFALMLISAGAVATVGLNAFFLDGLAQTLGYAGRAALAFLVVAALLLVLYVASFRRRQLAAGILMYVAVLAVLVTLAFAFSTGESVYDDVEGNYLYFVFVTVASATGCFALTRTLAGSALWFASASFACAAVQALYQTEEIAMSLLAVLSALALIVHRNFRLGLARADAAKAPSPSRNFAASALPVAVVGALALAVWFLIIVPLNPAVAKITLVVDYRRLPIEELKGTAEERPVLNYDMTSQNLVDGFYYTTDDLKEDQSSSVTIDAASLLEQQLRQQVTNLSDNLGNDSGGGTRETLDEESLNPEYDAVSWSERFPWIILTIVLALVAVACIVAFFVGRRVHRTRRLKRMLSLPPRRQVEELYTFELSRLSRLGFKVPTGATLSEFAVRTERQMDMITEETQVGFGTITHAYEACAYGRHEPSEDEVVPLVAYYLRLWKAARVHLGPFKYFFRSFRL